MNWLQLTLLMLSHPHQNWERRPRWHTSNHVCCASSPLRMTRKEGFLTCTLWAGPGAAMSACATIAGPPASACSKRHSWFVMSAISSCRRSVSTLISAIFSAADAVRNASLRSTRWRVLFSSRRTNLRSSSNWMFTYSSSSSVDI